jgi:hypothetical protein
MQRYSVQGYTIAFWGQTLNIRTPAELSLRITGYNPATNVEEPLSITVHSGVSARVETSRHLLDINYIQDPNDPNGQIAFSEKVPGSDIPHWSALQNGVPKQVITVLIAVVNDDPAADEYLVHPNNNAYENVNSNRDPEGNLGNNGSNDPTEGGKRRRRKAKTRRVRRA